MRSLVRSVGVLALVLVAACGDDGAHHLADAPPPPDSAVDATPDAPTDAPANVVLTVTLSGNGAGTVKSSVGGIDCGATCADDYPPNTIVTLTAEPAVGSVFTGWSGGGCSGTMPTCDVTLAQAATVTATFTLQTFTVTINRVGAGAGTVMGTGGINCGATCTATVDYGTSITLTATPIALSNFTGWSAPCTGTGTCTTTITANTTITAAFALDEISMTVAKSGNGSGTVTSTPAGINCGADCDEIYVANTMVTLAATPATGSTFMGWSGAGCNGTGTCTVTMTAAVLVTATFALDTFQLDVVKAGNGTGTVTSTPAGIACGADCNEVYNYGTAVTLTATPGVGSTFTGWSGGGCSGTGTCVTTVTAATSVTATFTLNQYLLTASLAGTGTGAVTSTPAGITCGADCNQLYNHGTVVALAAAPATGSVFSGWSGACTGMGACMVTMDSAKNVTATFTLNTYALTVALAGNGAGSVASSPAGISCGADCTEIYGHGTVVTLTPTAMMGTSFTGWSGACTGMGTCTVTMDAAKAVTATFTLQTFALNVTRAGNGSGTVTSTPAGINCGADCAENYNYGQVVTLTQAATTGSTFTGWSGACTGMGTCIVTMDAAKSVTATFTLDTLLLTVATAGNGSGSVASTPAGIACGVDCTELYNYGTVVTLTATPNATTSTFAGWSGACTGMGTCTVTMDAAKSVTATFTLKTYALTVALSGTGAGSVSSVPAGIACGIDCTETYNHGTSVTLTASASTGSTFGGWGGACAGAGTATTCTVSMTQVQNVSASFTLNTYALTVNKLGTGSGTVSSTPIGISCGADCSEVYNHGTVVMLTQSAATGSMFAGWSGACTGMGTCTVTMDAVKSVSATFTLNTYTLATTVVGGGTITSLPAGINCGADCSEIYNHGTVVALTATNATGYTFSGWSGACTGMGACSVTMDAAKSVTATFTLNTYNLHVGVTGSGTVTSLPAGINCGADCDEIYSHGTSVTLTATNATGYTFTSWGGACTGTATTCTLSMTQAQNVTATFTLNTYNLHVAVTGSGTVTSLPAGISCGADCDEIYSHGTSVTLTATNATGYTFTGWGGACAGTATTCTLSMTQAQNVTATFTLNTYLLVVTKNGTSTGTVTSLPAGITCGADCMEAYGHGTTVTLTATPDAGAEFAGWTGGCTGLGTCTVSMTAARSVTATFNIAVYTLTVVNSSVAGGQGTVTDNFNGISCGTNCTEPYNAGTTVTLTATPDPGSNFIGWVGGVGCTDLSLTCKVDMSSAQTVRATFSAPNVMFVTASTYRGNFAGGTPAGANAFADAECQAAASQAGLVGNGPGKNPEFRAWISSVNSAGQQFNARDRFTGSAGWIRAGDWKPVMNSIDDIGANKIWYPPRTTQAGADLGAATEVWTGTDANGNYSGVACNNQGISFNTGSTAIFSTIGLPSANASPISQFLDLNCGSSRRLICMGTGRNTSVGAPPTPGARFAFTTESSWLPDGTGITSADNRCQQEATAAGLPGSYLALLAPAGATAMSRFAQTGRPWIRVGDRQAITATDAAMFSTNTTVLDVAPNATATGNRVGNVSIYTGAPTLTTPGDAAGTCQDWKVTTEFKATGGFAFDTGVNRYFFGAQPNNIACNVPRRLVCLAR